jgi:hypothetical protein
MVVVPNEGQRNRQCSHGNSEQNIRYHGPHHRLVCQPRDVSAGLYERSTVHLGWMSGVDTSLRKSRQSKSLSLMASLLAIKRFYISSLMGQNTLHGSTYVPFTCTQICHGIVLNFGVASMPLSISRWVPGRRCLLISRGSHLGNEAVTIICSRKSRAAGCVQSLLLRLSLVAFLPLALYIFTHSSPILNVNTLVKTSIQHYNSFISHIVTALFPLPLLQAINMCLYTTSYHLGCGHSTPGGGDCADRRVSDPDLESESWCPRRRDRTNWVTGLCDECRQIKEFEVLASGENDPLIWMNNIYMAVTTCKPPDPTTAAEIDEEIRRETFRRKISPITRLRHADIRKHVVPHVGCKIPADIISEG